MTKKGWLPHEVPAESPELALALKKLKEAESRERAADQRALDAEERHRTAVERAKKAEARVTELETAIGTAQTDLNAERKKAETLDRSLTSAKKDLTTANNSLANRDARLKNFKDAFQGYWGKVAIANNAGWDYRNVTFSYRWLSSEGYWLDWKPTTLTSDNDVFWHQGGVLMQVRYKLAERDYSYNAGAMTHETVTAPDNSDYDGAQYHFCPTNNNALTGGTHRNWYGQMATRRLLRTGMVFARRAAARDGPTFRSNSRCPDVTVALVRHEAPLLWGLDL